MVPITLGFNPLRHLKTAASLTAIFYLCTPLCAQDVAQSLSGVASSAPVEPAPDLEAAPMASTRDKWNNFVHETASPLTMRRRLQRYGFPTHQDRSSIWSRRRGLRRAFCRFPGRHRQSKFLWRLCSSVGLTRGPALFSQRARTRLLVSSRLQRKPRGGDS